MALERADAGNVYASLFETEPLQIDSPAGDALHSIAMPCPVTNLTFGGADCKRLFITCAGQLDTLAMPIAGQPY